MNWFITWKFSCNINACGYSYTSYPSTIFCIQLRSTNIYNQKTSQYEQFLLYLRKKNYISLFIFSSKHQINLYNISNKYILDNNTVSNSSCEKTILARKKIFHFLIGLIFKESHSQNYHPFIINFSNISIAINSLFAELEPLHLYNSFWQYSNCNNPLFAVISLQINSCLIDFLSLHKFLLFFCRSLIQ